MGAGVPREIGGTRVAATPKAAARLRKLGYHVLVESGAGLGASLSDDTYREVGGVIVDNARDRDIILAVGVPSDTQLLDIHPGATLTSFLTPRQDPSLIRRVTAQGVNVFSIDMVPRTSRAQALDALSSLANISDYRAVVETACAFGRFFTGQMTAADKVPPATMSVTGTGVARLVAIGAANSLGVAVRATDVRSETAEQVTSMGATFPHAGQADQGVSSDSYAKGVDADYAMCTAELYVAQAHEVDIIITTAAILGKPSPRLITAEMVGSMKPDSVIADMTAIDGGSYELTRPGENYVTGNGVTIIGYADLFSRLSGQSSQLYDTDLVNAFKLITPGKDGNLAVDFDDKVVCSMIIVRDGEVTLPSPKIKVSAAPVLATTARPSMPATPAKPPRPR